MRTNGVRPPIGTKIGMLTYLEPIPGDRSRFALFECVCGTRKRINFYKVLDGGTKSCGCLRRAMRAGHASEMLELGADAPRTHKRKCRKCNNNTHNYFHCSECLERSTVAYAADLECV